MAPLSNEEPQADQAATGRLDVAFEPTLPAPIAPGPVVKSIPRNNVVPLALMGRFQNIRRIGAGGMGVVYRAFDPKLGRDVALKVLKHADAESSTRFLREAQAQARVEHDNICRVYEVGEADGEPFIVMQLIDGEPLTVARGRMALRERVALLQKVANAIHMAHTRGLVHRDIKPGNILVETREDGSFRPYIVDFGIARDLNPNAAHTLEGTMGTPAYLAPEVATHRGRSIVDVRVDVYGLGATLYDVIAGRAPYVGQDAWHILERLTKEDPPPLRAITKRVPAELEAIVMKCLERDPLRRYSTAAALADDLQRFLDGEPITARRVGIVYALRRMLRKHGRLALAALVVGTFVAAFAITRRNAAKQAEQAQDLGRTVKEMELYMRTAYQMPAHDIERERAVVRERIKELEKRVLESGAEKSALALYAFGRAYLALGDSVRACEYLEQAKGAGYTSPELNYALARAQIAAHLLLTTRTRAYGSDPKQIDAEVAVLDTKYLKPALELLHAAEPASIEDPMYALALMASAEARHEDAAEKAHRAFELAPLLYEAKVIEGNALAEIATRHWHSGKSDWWKSMSAGMEGALAAFGAAENIARSDPTVLQAICGTRTRLMYAAYSTRKVAIRPYYEAAREVCNRLVTVDPSWPEGHTSRAAMHAHYAYALARLDEPETDPVPIAEEAIGIAEEAKLISKGGLPAYQALGNALLAQARVLVDRGRPATEALAMAERHFQEARGIFKYEESLRTGLMTVDLLRIVDERRRGIDVAPHVARANLVIDETIAAQPKSFAGYLKRTLVLTELIRQQVGWGRLPKESLDAAFEAVASAKKINPAFTFFYNNADIHGIMAQHALDQGTSPREALDEMAKDLAAFYEEDEDTAMWREFSGVEATLRAEWQLQHGEDPSEFLDLARKALNNATKRAPVLIELAVELARVELIAAQYAVVKKSATAETFEKVRAPLQSFLVHKLSFPDAYVVAAESHALAAEWRLSRHESPEDEIKTGLATSDLALATNPKHANAWVVRARLLLVQAQSNQHAEAAKKAVDAFEEAFRCNPLLERHHRAALTRAQEIR